MFSKEVQLEAVKMYLSGVPTGQIRKKFNIRGSATILNWVTNIEHHGLTGVKDAKRAKTNYSYSFKLKVINWRLRKHASLPVAAKKFGIRNPSMIWMRERAIEEGRLKPSKRGRTTMSKPEDDRIKELEKENFRLQVELAYLKKLEALAQQKRALKTKQKR